MAVAYSYKYTSWYSNDTVRTDETLAANVLSLVCN